jgi:hypothetical protein
MNKSLFATIEGMSINDLTDVDTNTTPPTNGQTIVWNSTTAKFEPGTAAANIGDLNDVDTTGVTNGQVLVYNSSTNIFEPGTVSGGGGSGGLYSLLDF